MFVSLCWLSSEGHDRQQDPSFFDSNRLTKILVPLSFVGMTTLHLLEMLVMPPANLPDIFPVLWSISGCGMIVIAWLITCWHLYRPETSIGGESSILAK